MKIEELICDFEFTEKLKELGVPQDTSYFVSYGRMKNNCFTTTFSAANQDLCNMISERDEKAQDSYISRFTVDELLEFLPKEIDHDHNEWSTYYICMGCAGDAPDIWVAWYEDNDLSGPEEILASCYDKKLPNSLAKLLIKLLEEKHIEL